MFITLIISIINIKDINMKHLRLFETEIEYTSEVDNLDLPCITYIEEASEIGVHKENYIIIKHNLTSSTPIDMAYILGGEVDLSTVKKMYIDDVEVNPDIYFPTSTSMGEHIVKIEFKRPLSSCRAMFMCSIAMTEVDFSHFDTSNVTDMVSMFSGCESLTSLDLSNFDTSNVTRMNSTFSDCRSLTSLKMMGNINNLQNAENIFSNIATTGTFYYNSAYDYSEIISALPSTWTAVAV